MSSLRIARTSRAARQAGSTLSITLVQRFGSAANLNIQLHCLMLDGVYRRTEGEPVFQQARAPTRDELQSLLDKIIARFLKGLTRLGNLAEEQGMTYLADIDFDNPLRSLQAAACTYLLRPAFALERHQHNHVRNRGALPDRATLNSVGETPRSRYPECRKPLRFTIPFDCALRLKCHPSLQPYRGDSNVQIHSQPARLGARAG